MSQTSPSTVARVVGAVVVLVAVGAAFPARAAGCDVAGRLTARADGWTSVTVPDFGVGEPGNIRVFAIAADDEDSVVVSNGTSVQRSTDGGCTWATVLRPQPAVPLVNEVTIAAIEHVPQIGGVDAVLVIAHESTVGESGGVERPRIWVGGDGGKTFEEGGTGLPLVGHVLGVREGLVPGVAVAAVAEPDGTNVRFFSTSDAGRLWKAAVPAGTANPTVIPARTPDFLGFVVDGRQPSRVWAWDSRALYRSGDGGWRFEQVNTMTVPVIAMDIAPSPDVPGEHRLRVFHSNGTSHYSDDLDATWIQEREPAGNVAAVASLPQTAGLYATSSARGVFVRSAKGPVRRMTPLRFAATDLELSVAVNPYLYAGNGASLLRRRLFTPASGLTIITDSVGVLNAPPPPLVRPARLLPEHSALRVDYGGFADVSYALSLPPVPTPLDIYFLADTTPSMAPVLNRLRLELAGVINDLAALGIASRVGLADFRDYPGFGGPTVGNYPYNRLRAVGPVDATLRAALDSMTTGGGNLDNTHAGLEALYQSATGAGRAVVEPAGTRVVHVPPGLGAQFRRDAVKVVVMASDRAWREAKPGYPGPSREEAFDALKSAGVHFVGLGVADDLDSGGGVGGPGPPMRDAAKATNTFAPAGGVDCDDDGAVDVPSGEPLVCRLSPDGSPKVGPAMLALLAAVIDRAAVRFDVNADGITAAVIGGGIFPAVDVKRPNTLRATVRYTCPVAAEATRGGARLTVSSRGAVLERSTAAVVCGPPAPAVEPALPREAVRAVAVALAPLPPPPPPAPINQPQPNPNPNTNPNANTAVVAERQNQLQVQLATEDLRSDREEYAFSALPARERTSPWALALAATAVAGTAACGLVLRSAGSLSPVRVRSGR